MSSQSHRPVYTRRKRQKLERLHDGRPHPKSARRTLGAISALVLAAAAVVAASGPAAAEEENGYTVVLNDSVTNVDTTAKAQGKEYGFTLSSTYEHALKGYSGTMTASEAAQLDADPAVDFVAPERAFTLAEDGADDTEPPAVTGFLPTWWLRVGGTPQEAAANGQEIAVNTAVIDSGIDSTHPDLNVRGGVDCSAGTAVSVIPVDRNGHGTMVAGVLAAKNNTFGVIGTAYGAPLWSVRVMTDAGTISEAALLCAADWVVSTRTDQDGQNDIQVANISIGGPGQDRGNCGNGVDPLHKMICQGVEEGVTWTAAAGNAAADLANTIPATYDEVLTATAMADYDGRPGGKATPICSGGSVPSPDDQFANFSNFAVQATDQQHTVAAPGVCITSTFPGGLYNTAHGTSFSSPAAAGAVARCIYSGMCQGNGQSVMKAFLATVEAYNQENQQYGFIGDPIRPASGKYYGYLTTTALCD
ncbi:S8 family serine peptidase [Arthrobacter sp.]|uniref:S8 family peptidase n=1 Tax=Arthrobacter sp. TaxID=1667 RepID=UPI0033921DD1